MKISYEELNKRANNVVFGLKELGLKPGDRAGVCIERGEELISVLIGMLKYGITYIPLDKNYPKERIRYIAKNSMMKLILTDDTDLEFGIKEKVKKIRIKSLLEKHPDDFKCEFDVNVNNIAYIIYTSGSTGLPKGVPITHKNMYSLLKWASSQYSSEELCKTLFSTSICFDLSIFEMFAPLFTGNAVVVVNNALDLIESDDIKVTLINTVPSIMRVLLMSLAVPSGVITVNLAGEKLTRDTVNKIYELGVSKVYNLYGPTEATTYITKSLVSKDKNDDVYIGCPIGENSIILVDINGELVTEQGAEGELCVTGDSVMKGYLYNESLTNSKFIMIDGKPYYKTGDLASITNDGYNYLGRIDSQIKFNGHRIELEEIEKVIRSYKYIDMCVVSVDSNNFLPSLVANIKLAKNINEEKTKITECLIEHLMKYLPRYMIPDKFKIIDNVILTPNGKIDREYIYK